MNRDWIFHIRFYYHVRQWELGEGGSITFFQGITVNNSIVLAYTYRKNKDKMVGSSRNRYLHLWSPERHGSTFCKKPLAMGTTFPKNHPFGWVWGSRLGPHTPVTTNPEYPPGCASLKIHFSHPPDCSLRLPFRNFSVPQDPTFAWNHKFLENLYLKLKASKSGEKLVQKPKIWSILSSKSLKLDKKSDL